MNPGGLLKIMLSFAWLLLKSNSIFICQKLPQKADLRE